MEYLILNIDFEIVFRSTDLAETEKVYAGLKGIHIVVVAKD